MTMRDDARAQRRAERLVGLVLPHLPAEVEARTHRDAWHWVAPALVARAAGSLEAIMALRPLGREADPIILLRSLYEHVTTFAWLAAEPDADRMGRWLKSDRAMRIKIDDDCRRLNLPLLDDETRADFERIIASIPNAMPDLLLRAEAADAHWVGQLPGFAVSSEIPQSFRGLYGIAYRRFSAVAHPSDMGLNFVATPIGGRRQRVGLETQHPETHGPFGLAAVVFGVGLFVASTSLGWPLRGDIEDAFAG